MLIFERTIKIEGRDKSDRKEKRMKTLVLAEKPSVGRDIARVLHCNKKTNTYIEGDQYIVTWGLGHLVTLADPEHYNPKYKEWTMESLPMIPKRMELVVMKQTAKQYKTVKELLYRKDVKDIVIATDAGREGELVARWILEKAGCKKPVKRLWISSVTDKAIKEGFSHLKDGKEYEPLYDAAVSRAYADWFVGINATRALTCKYNAQLSCGRVQTPTLAMIAKREEEIRAFRPEPYYGLKVRAAGVTFTWQDSKSGNTRCFEKKKIEAIKQRCEGQRIRIETVQKKAKKTYSPALYDLTELQREANQRFGYSAKETLNIMQRLYENHKVLTYPRTDSRYVSSDIVDTIKERLKSCGVGMYRGYANTILKRGIKASKHFVDDSKVSDHHAIIPTEEYVNIQNMTQEERKIYDLVVRRFFSVLYPPCEYEQTTITGMMDTEMFVVTGKRIINSGYYEVYEQENEEETLPEFEEGRCYEAMGLMITEGKTTPPAYFTEATLLLAMENPTKYMSEQNTKMAKTLKETGGLGTVATRADIIDKLFRTFLMEKKGNEIHITSKAKQLLELVPEDLKKPELTASWEMKLKQIAENKRKKDDFLREIQQYTKDVVEEIKGGEGTFRHDNVTNKKCPECGKRLLSVANKNAKLLVCQDRTCGYRERLAKITNARCPVCHKKMELWGKDDNQTFICACGHKERLSAFEERRKKEGAGVSKKDVNRYMKQIEKEAKTPVNNAFAAALKNITL